MFLDRKKSVDILPMKAYPKNATLREDHGEPVYLTICVIFDIGSLRCCLWYAFPS